MKQQIEALFAGITKELGVDNAVIVVTTPENSEHGDYSTNIAMILAGRLKAPPMQIAQKIVDLVKVDQKNSLIQWLERVEIAPPGFINLFLNTASLGAELNTVLTEKERYGATRYTSITSASSKNAAQNPSSPTGQTDDKSSGQKNNAKKEQKNKKHTEENTLTAEKDGSRVKEEFGNSKESVRTVMVEFAHPNTHKAFHIGHLRNITTGESVVRLLESQGAHVVRANYQGDVGMHIAKALYALLNVSPYKDDVRGVEGIKNRVEFLGKAYAAGSAAFEESDEVKKQIGEINKQIYAKDPAVYPLYRETRQWSLDYFESIYARVGSHFDRYYFESEVYEQGKAFVQEGVKTGVFKESDGAIIFPGEDYGLHNRVFVTSEGNATYEGKEIALGRLQFDEYNPSLIVHCVGPEQAGYFQVLFKALEQMFPETTGREYHLVYGWVKLKEGKMSSRLGNVVLGEWLIEEVKKEVQAIIDANEHKQEGIDKEVVSEALAIAAVKYAFLKVSTNQEIAFDLKESININGDSGPYLLYTYARAMSVLRKSEAVLKQIQLSDVSPDERAVLRLIMQFPDIVKAAADHFAPNTLCTYLFILAQRFNLLYAKESILGNDVRLAITAATAQVIKNGLSLLGIPVLERM
jgi:arginyl-tRNA synthetase